MAFPDRSINSERPFEGKKIYYSGSIRGVPNPDPNFAWDLVQHMIVNGANVLSEHVAARNKHDMREIFYEKSGINMLDIECKTERARIARKQDLEWVNEATHFVALVDSPSLGVGVEIEHTILKPKLGLNNTPMLFLVNEQVINADTLSNMITGIDREAEDVDFQICIYQNTEDAKRIITEFLLSH